MNLKLKINPGEVEERIKNFIRRKVGEANATGVVLGLSGGLDSSVVVILSSNALGGENVWGVIMPEKSTRNGSNIRDAEELAEKFGIKIFYKDITSVVKAATMKGFDSKMARANLKARVRMMVLYQLANSSNKLVVGTGNKSEIMTGYFTKYGDGGVDILPIGDLYKTQVRELAEYMNVPKKIIHKKPSANLWEGQTDEDEMGILYEELDRILSGLKTGKVDDISKERINHVKKLIEKSEHKRKMPPVCRI